MALDVGKIFYASKNVIAYSNLRNRTSDLSASDSLCARCSSEKIFDGKIT